MNLPPTSANDRRAVPRHMRDGEHHEWDDAATAEDGRARLQRLAPWILGLVVLAGIAAWWLYQGRG